LTLFFSGFSVGVKLTYLSGSLHISPTKSGGLGVVFLRRAEPTGINKIIVELITGETINTLKSFFKGRTVF